MAVIDDILSKILSAVYGKDVRQSIHDGIKTSYDISSEAKSVADTAKSTADTAKSTADTAKSTANTAKTTANTASTTANTAKTTAEAASATATEAKTTAEAATATANTAKSTADTAKSTADTAKSTATTANTTATTANTTANNALTAVNNKITELETQSTNIGIAIQSANDAVKTANTAAQRAENAANSVDSVLSGSYATSSTYGVVKPDNNTITVANGVISVDKANVVPANATTSAAGIVKPDGTTIKVSSGKISVPTATTSALGLVKPDGTTITVSSGKISVNSANVIPANATTTTAGIVKPDGTSISVTDGVISVNQDTIATKTDVESMKESFQDGCDQIVSKIATTVGDTRTSIDLADIITGIGDVYNKGVSDTKKGNATAAQVLKDKTFTNSSKVEEVGTMPNHTGEPNASFAANGSYTIGEGYYDGKKVITATHSATYTLTSSETGTKDLGESHNYRYVSATNVYNAGKSSVTSWSTTNNKTDSGSSTAALTKTVTLPADGHYIVAVSCARVLSTTIVSALTSTTGNVSLIESKTNSGSSSGTSNSIGLFVYKVSNAKANGTITFNGGNSNGAVGVFSIVAFRVYPS